MRSSGVSTGQNGAPQMRDAFKALSDAAGENLATPNRAVVAVTRAVKAKSNHARVPGTTLGDHGRDVRTMMLHRDRFGCRQLGRIACRNVLRMRVMNEQQFVRIDLIHRKQILDRFPEGTEGLVMIQISDVLTNEGLTIDDESDRAFEVGTESEYRSGDGQSRNGAGCISARATKNRRTKGADACNGIVDTASDGPLPNQESIRDPRELMQGIG